MGHIRAAAPHETFDRVHRFRRLDDPHAIRRIADDRFATRRREMNNRRREPPPFSMDTRATPPHDLTDKSVLDSYPRGPGGELLNRLMAESVSIFADHPANARRRAAGKLPATNIWLWGLGSTPRLTPFAQRYGIQGAMITAVDLLRGLAVLLGWRRIEVPGATGYTDTDYAAKGRYAVQALEESDLVCVHVEATDEASHEGDTAAKVKALEAIDEHIVAPVFEALKKHGEYRILVEPDHRTTLRTRATLRTRTSSWRDRSVTKPSTTSVKLNAS